MNSNTAIFFVVDAGVEKCYNSIKASQSYSSQDIIFFSWSRQVYFYL